MATTSEALAIAVQHHQAGRLQAAAANYRQILAVEPDHADAWHLLGVISHELGEHDLAVERIRRAIALQGSESAFHNNLGTALQLQGKLDEAIASYREALKLRPQYAQAHYNLATAWEAQGKIEEAIASYQRAVELQPDDAMAHKNLSLLLLLRGEFERGWPEYEWRWKCEDYGMRAGTQPPWDGSASVGTILLHADQGLGDTLQFIRYAPLVKQRVREVWLRCPRGLIPLVSRCRGFDQLFPHEAQLPTCDAECFLTSLPLALQTTLANIPRQAPYLFADPTLIEQWRARLPVNGFRVGIAWQGNPQFKQDRTRSIPLASFAPLADIPDVRLISLQKVHGSEQLAAVKELFPVLDLGPNLDETAGAFMDTAAVMMNLDLVVTSDTAVAHLAGGLGVPVWLALSFIPEWRWMLDRDDSPWYPTMRLFRQKTPGDWKGVMYEIRENLCRLVAGGG